MRFIALFHLLFISFFGFSQKHYFFKTLNSLDFIDYSDSIRAENSEIDILNFDNEAYKNIFFTEINQHKNRRSRPSLEPDSIYNKICETILLTSHRRLLRRNWAKNKKFIYQSLIQYHSHFRYYKVFSFKIDLVNYNGGGFYYDKNDPKTNIHLISGNRKDNNKMLVKDEEFELKYILPKTEMELFNAITYKFIQNFGLSNFKSRYFSQIGFAIEIDKKTLNKKAIPQAKIVIIIGGKIMSKIRV